MAKEYITPDAQIRSDAVWKAIELVRATVPAHNPPDPSTAADAVIETATKFYKFMSEGK